MSHWCDILRRGGLVPPFSFWHMGGFVEQIVVYSSICGFPDLLILG